MTSRDSDGATSIGAVDLNIEELLKNAQIGMTSIREFSETAKAVAADAAESQRLTAVSFADVQSKLAEISTAATQAVAAKTQIVADQGVIATKSDHIQKAQEHADTVRGNLDRELTAAKQQATEAEGLKTRAQSAADTAVELLTDVRTAKGSVEKDAEDIATALKAAEQSAAVTKGLAEKSATVEERVAGYESRLADLESMCAAQLKTIEGLLPGATSAGLAHDFDKRRQTFLEPQRKWEKVFVHSVVVIALLAGASLLQMYWGKATPTIDEVLVMWLSRAPIAVVLVWLALHASRESALAKRLEEDYGYKSAIASCFEGFRKQMSEISKDVADNSPLAKLCEDTLATVASPPGRIYDKHQLTVSPADEVMKAAKTAADAAKGKG
jgi:hypothetical protein